MIKRIHLLLLTAAWLIPQVSHAQFMGFSFKSNNQIFIEQALQHAFVNVEQSYQLQDTIHNEIFGRDGKDYFSIIPFLGMRTLQGLLIAQDAVHPWKYDEDFNQYEGKYKPIVFRSKLTYLRSELESKETSPVVTEVNVQKLTETPFALYVDSLHRNGLMCDTVAGSKSGWMVWVIDTKNQNRPDSIRLVSYKKDLYIKHSTDTISVDIPDNNQPILGGIFVNPVQTHVGQITFLLTGVAVGKDKHWILHFPFLAQAENEKNELTIIKSESNQNKFPKKKKK